MYLKSLSLLIISVFLITNGCISDENEAHPYHFEKIQVFDKGYVMPDSPQMQTIIQASGRIAYSEVTSQSNDTLAAWQNTISDVDLAVMDSVFVATDIIEQTDVELPQGEDGCVGGAAIDIYVLSSGDQENTFSIPGTVRCRDEWIPENVRQFLAHVDSIRSRYQSVPVH